MIELFLGGGAGAYTQSSFAVIQACVPETDAASGLALMLIGKLFTSLRLHSLSNLIALSPQLNLAA